MSTKLKAVENPDEELDVESAAVEFTEELPPLHVAPTSFDARVAGVEPCSVILELSQHYAGVAGVKVEQAELRGEVKTHEDEGRVLREAWGKAVGEEARRPGGSTLNCSERSGPGRSGRASGSGIDRSNPHVMRYFDYFMRHVVGQGRTYNNGM